MSTYKYKITDTDQLTFIEKLQVLQDKWLDDQAATFKTPFKRTGTYRMFTAPDEFYVDGPHSYQYPLPKINGFKGGKLNSTGNARVYTVHKTNNPTLAKLMKEFNKKWADISYAELGVGVGTLSDMFCNKFAISAHHLRGNSLTRTRVLPLYIGVTLLETSQQITGMYELTTSEFEAFINEHNAHVRGKRNETTSEG